jgi:carbon-monoxide dehydrogenase small subunit
VTISTTFRLNGESITVSTEPERRLIDLLREDLERTAAKRACSVGRCGACMVLVDGEPVNACLLMAWQLHGADIITPEGLDLIAEARFVRDGLAEENAFQCGYCAPGFTVTLTALLARMPRPDEQDIRSALAGNLCRCTGYQSIIRGALRAAELRSADG